MIPKLVHIYWDSKKHPRIVKFCIRKIRHLNPDFRICVYDSSFYNDLIESKNFKFITKEAHKADFVRLYVLSLYGGIWIDASIIINTPLKKIVFLEKNTIQAYQTVFAENNKNIETCFIASPQSNVLMKTWLLEFSEACRLGFWEYRSKNKKYQQKVAKMQRT